MSRPLPGVAILVRGSNRGRRIVPVAIALAALALLAAASIVHVPSGRIGVLGRAGSSGRTIDPGLHLRIPFVEDLLLVGDQPVDVKGMAPLVSPEGSTLDVPFSCRLDPRRADPAALIGLARDGDLAAAGVKTFDRTFRTAVPGSTADPSARFRAAEENLAPLGLVPGSLSFGSAQGRGVSLSEELAQLKRAYAGPRFKVLLVGIDSADWETMAPLMDRGDLPALAALRDRGAWGNLRSSVPALSPLLWTTIATGKTPDQHGIVDFLARDPVTGAERPITSRSRRVRALWSILTDLGIPSLTVGWWATWPAERVEGAMYSDRLAYSLLGEGGSRAGPDAMWPQQTSVDRLVIEPESIRYEEVRSIVDVDRAEFEAARRSLPDPASWKDPLAHLIRILASTRTYHRLALERIRSDQPPLSLVYYEGLDEINHRFAHYVEPAMKWANPAKVRSYARAVASFYVLQDRLVGELVAAADPNTVVIVVSDHGFASGDRRPTDVPPDIEGKPGRWHTMFGVLLAAGPTVKAGRLQRDPGILDITPTILALLSLPAARDMPGAVITEIADPRSIEPPAMSAIATYEPGSPSPASPAPHDAESPADREMIAKLTALGYIGSSGDAPATPDLGRPAPGHAESGSTSTFTGHLNAANVLLSRGDARRAEAEYREAVHLAPTFVPARLGLGQCLIVLGREDEGWKEIRAALMEGDTPDAGTYFKVAIFYRQRRRGGEGAALFESLPRREALEPARLTSRGMLLRQAGDEEGAERSLREALEQDPSLPEGLQEIYSLLTKRGDLDALVRILEKGHRARPGGTVAANLLALTYERAGRSADASALLTSTLESSPRDLATLTNLGGLLLREGRAGDAVAVLKRARDVDPANVEALVNLIVALGRTRDLRGARREFGGAGAAADKVHVLNAMAYACFINGSLDEAKDLITKSLDRSRDQSDARSLLAAIERAASSSSKPASSGPGAGL